MLMLDASQLHPIVPPTPPPNTVLVLKEIPKFDKLLTPLLATIIKGYQNPPPSTIGFSIHSYSTKRFMSDVELSLNRQIAMAANKRVRNNDAQSCVLIEGCETFLFNSSGMDALLASVYLPELNL